MTLLIHRAHTSVACMGTASSRGLISQGDNRNTPLDAKEFLLKLSIRLFYFYLRAHRTDNPLLVKIDS